MSFLNQIQIKWKLLIIAVLLIASLVILIAAFYYVQSVSNQATKQHDSHFKAHLLVEKIKQNIIQAREYESRFLLNHDLEYNDNYHNVMVKIDQLVKSVKQINTDNKLINLLLEIQQKTHDYQQQFTTVVSLHKQIGMDHQTGLQGELRRTVHKVEDLLAKHNEISLTNSMLMMRRHEKDFLLREQEKYIHKLQAQFNHFGTLLQAALLSVEDKNTIKALITDYKNKFEALASIRLEMNTHIALLADTVAAIYPRLDMLNDYINKLDRAETAKAERIISNMAKFYYGIALLLILIFVPLLYLLANTISKSVERIAVAMKKLATGEANIQERLELVGDDEMTEIARWFNQLMDKLQTMLNEINNLANNLADTAISTQVAKNQTTEAIYSQVQKISAITTSIEAITTTIDKVAQDASNASEQANEVDQAARRGNDEVVDAIDSIKSLADNVEQAVVSVKKIDEYSGNIETIVAMINSIAEQTNLLALNAAIEAARAGEAGRGFAVVADEVRTLSKRTTDSTEEIRDMIVSLQQGTSQAVEVMNQSQDKAVVSVQKAQLAGDSIESITEAISCIASLNSEIKEAAIKQSTAANQINNNISEINEATNQMAETAQQTMSDSGDLSQTATLLQMMVGQFDANKQLQENQHKDTSKTDKAVIDDVELF